jgi:NAD(P)-dependent dehydrogenase (short-subunit alcohol dehydrogenase family)
MTESQPRAAIVTGASRGIGFAIAKALVDRGDRVCITGRDAATLASAAEELGGKAIAVAGKACAAHQDEAIAMTMEQFGRVDYPSTTSARTGLRPMMT